MFPGTDRPVRATFVADENKEESRKTLTTVDSYSHALSSGSSRSVYNPKVTASGPRSENIHLDISGYSTALKSSNAGAAASIFDPSQSTKQMIDFNEVESSTKLTPNLNSEPLTTSGQPAFKKRKITIISEAAKAKLDRKRMKAEEDSVVPLPSTSVGYSSNPTQTPTVVIHGNKKESAAEYLKLVKSTLDAIGGYLAFSDMIKVYRREKNFQLLISSLKNIFLEPPSLRPFFKGNLCLLVVLYFI